MNNSQSLLFLSFRNDSLEEHWDHSSQSSNNCVKMREREEGRRADREGLGGRRETGMEWGGRVIASSWQRQG